MSSAFDARSFVKLRTEDQYNPYSYSRYPNHHAWCVVSVGPATGFFLFRSQSTHCCGMHLAARHQLVGNSSVFSAWADKLTRRQAKQVVDAIHEKGGQFGAIVWQFPRECEWSSEEDNAEEFPYRSMYQLLVRGGAHKMPVFLNENSGHLLCCLMTTHTDVKGW